MEDQAASVKQQMPVMWSRCAKAFGDHMYDEMALKAPIFARVTAKVLEHADSKRDAVILDLGSGPGEPGLSIAASLPTAKVILTDIAPGMVEEAKQRASTRGITNAEFRIVDAEDLSEFASGSVDVVTAVSCLYFLPNYSRALEEVHRVLKPGGVVIASVWDSAERADLLRLTNTLQGELGSKVPDPHPLARGDTEFVLSTLTMAGFQHTSFEEVNCPMRIEAGRLGGLVWSYPVPLLLMDRYREQGHPNPEEEVLATVEKHVAQAGFRKDDGSYFLPDNIAHVYTAKV